MKLAAALLALCPLGCLAQSPLQEQEIQRAIIQLETGCFANLTPAHVKILKKIPILIVEGDHYDTPRPPPECVTMRQQINAAGGDMTYLQLPQAGLFGNSHMFMQDKTYRFVSNGSVVPAGLVTNVRIGQDVDIVTARINYRFGGPAVARY